MKRDVQPSATTRNNWPGYGRKPMVGKLPLRNKINEMSLTKKLLNNAMVLDHRATCPRHTDISSELTIEQPGLQAGLLYGINDGKLTTY